jgi:carboxynorspermidine decarboxylase
MPYQPRILGQSYGKYTYQLTGITCLSGDIIGDYGFDRPLVIGDRVVFEDVAPYTMVKNTTFNGIALPDIYTYSREKKLSVMRTFDYTDFIRRLG